MKPFSVLGISSEHDAGVCLFEDGTWVWAANEERYTRKKFQTGTPYRSLEKLAEELHDCGKQPPDVIAVASRFHIGPGLGEWMNLDWKYELLERAFSVSRLDRILWGSAAGPELIAWLSQFQQASRRRELAAAVSKIGVKNPRFQFVDHHLCHAAAAYLASGWDSCLVITQDASGDAVCSRVYRCREGRMEEVHMVPFFHSPGHYYEYVTFLFGFKIGREGKVTGLAAYGDPSKTFPIFEREMDYDPKIPGYVNHALYRKPEMRRLKKLLEGYSREDIAAGVQKHLESMMTRYIADMIRLYAGGEKVKLAVAGGVFANVKLNQKVAALSEVSSLFVYPHMGDGGLAAGAAMSVSMSAGVRPGRLRDVYLGDSPGQKDIDAVLERYKRQVVARRPDDLPEAAARFLAAGKTVAVVRGPMEYGPRALGHRTLLSQATDSSINGWLNKQLRRSEFMPFAPVLRKEDAGRYFTGWRKALPSLPYMTVTVDCNARAKREAPAIVHVDGTARPQLVDRRTEPFIHDVLTSYRKRTGLRILINTSYNIHEEPIVRTPEDAVKTFIDGAIDVLILNDTVITRKKR